jgi:hypothetical protein
MMICWKYSYQKVTQSSQVNNVLDAPVYNIFGFLLRDSYVSSTQLDRLILNKISLSPK